MASRCEEKVGGLRLINALLHAIRGADLGVYHFLNGYAGQQLINRLAAFEEENNLLKGGLFLAAYACLWFHRGPDRENRRRETIAIFVGTMLAIVVSRIVADILPFRIRPMYEPAITHRPYALRSWAIWNDGVLSQVIPPPTSPPWPSDLDTCCAATLPLSRSTRRFGYAFRVYSSENTTSLISSWEASSGSRWSGFPSDQSNFVTDWLRGYSPSWIRSPTFSTRWRFSFVSRWRSCSVTCGPPRTLSSTCHFI